MVYIELKGGNFNRGGQSVNANSYPREKSKSEIYRIAANFCETTHQFHCILKESLSSCIRETDSSKNHKENCQFENQ